MLMEQFKYGKCLHYYHLSVLLWKALFASQNYFSKLIHCISSHCRAISISISIAKLEHFLFFFKCVHCVTFNGKIIRSKAQSSGTKFVAYEISILCSFSYCQLWVLGFKRLNSHFILVSILVD